MSEGSIEQREGRVTYRYERHLHHSIDAVWKTITDPDQIERWTGNRPEIDLRPGGEYVSYHRGGDRVVDRVIRVEPPRLFEHTFWVHINPTALVTWELGQAEGGCRLVLTHSVNIEDLRNAAQTFGDDIAVILSRNGSGWHRLLDKLGGALDGRMPTWSEQDLKILQERYAAMLKTH